MPICCNMGCFHPVHDRLVAAEIWLQDYIATYVERDVRALLNIKDDYWRTKWSPATLDPWMIYGGDKEQIRQREHVVPWGDMEVLPSELTSTR